jgi:hypothetical protein
MAETGCSWQEVVAVLLLKPLSRFAGEGLG